MAVESPVESRQLNLGPVPVVLIEGLDYWADRDDLSRAQLARRVIADYLEARFREFYLREQVRSAYEQVAADLGADQAQPAE